MLVKPFISLERLLSWFQKKQLKIKQLISTDKVSNTSNLPITVLRQSTPWHLDELQYDNKNTQSLMLRIHHYDWSDVIKLIINHMLKIKDIKPGSILLLNNISNSTNGSLNTDEAMEIIRNILVDNDKFTLISIHQLSLVKEQLGLLPQDNFDTFSKSISIARYIRAHYLLYIDTIGNVNTSTLQVKLMLVKTRMGEIIWSDKCTIYRQKITFLN